MPSYFYHIKFELYPYPTAPREAETTKSAPATAKAKGNAAEAAWIPSPGADIFDTRSWPRHPRARGGEGEENIRLDRREYEYLTGKKSTKRGSLGVERKEAEGAAVVIDCGLAKGSSTYTSTSDTEGANKERISAVKVDSAPLSRNPALVARDQGIAVRDYRFGRVRVESVDIVEMDDGHGPGVRRGESSMSAADLGNGISAGLAVGESVGRVMKGRFEQLEGRNTEVGWGIVHLYRDGEETPGLNAGSEMYTAQSYSTVAAGGVEGEKGKEEEEEDCTMLCIPAVPTYLTYNDFLGFAGKKTIEEVQHFRMVMTGWSNRYLVLMKFRESKAARRWKAEWDGKLFIEMEPETCHILFVKSITVQTPSPSNPCTSFPELSHDPFTPTPQPYPKPFPPPTHSLVELPTCPVCLERMDETTGLLTILCQHLFHCACLQKWRGRGCPVCRHTNPSLALASQSPTPSSATASYDPSNPPFGSGDASLCSVCDCTEDLWICLICGKVGCGRYKGGHAKEHWKESAHNFALEIETQHVWDYAEDAWVHRLIREKGDSKVIELPSSRSGFGLGRGGGGRDDREEENDMVPREKLERIGLEYTHLLTSQLESQRVYFEELVSKAVAKASAATSAAAVASARADDALSQLSTLKSSHDRLRDDVLPALERDVARERRRADKSSELARGFGKSLTEEKEVNAGLLKRIEHVNASMATLSKEMGGVREENADLREQNRDLLFSITAGERLRDMEGREEGGLEAGEVEGGTVSLPVEREREKERKGRRGKGRK